MITALMFLAAVSPYNTFNDLYLYQNPTSPPSYKLVSVLKLQQDQYEIRTLETHKGPICSKEMVDRSDLIDLIPFYYGTRVYVSLGYSVKSGTVVGQTGDWSLVHYEGRPCEDYARLVPTSSIIPIN